MSSRAQAHPLPLDILFHKDNAQTGLFKVPDSSIYLDEDRSCCYEGEYLDGDHGGWTESGGRQGSHWTEQWSLLAAWLPALGLGLSHSLTLYLPLTTITNHPTIFTSFKLNTYIFF